MQQGTVQQLALTEHNGMNTDDHGLARRYVEHRGAAGLWRSFPSDGESLISRVGLVTERPVAEAAVQ